MDLRKLPHRHEPSVRSHCPAPSKWRSALSTQLWIKAHLRRRSALAPKPKRQAFSRSGFRECLWLRFYLNFEFEFEFESNKSRPSLISAKLDLIFAKFARPKPSQSPRNEADCFAQGEGGREHKHKRLWSQPDEKSGRKFKPKIFTENWNFR